jgi:hypothetical protein
MSKGIHPLFVLKDKKGKVRPVDVAISEGGTFYEPNSFISEVVEEIEEDVDDIVTGKSIAKISVAGYILLEALHRSGNTEIVKTLLSSTGDLFHASVYCAIGMESGARIDNRTEFSTVQSEGNSSIWDFSSREGE